jgi:cytochrome P450
MPVVVDPRLGNTDPTLLEEPHQFQPLRWVPKKAKLLDDESTTTSTSGASNKCPFAGTAREANPKRSVIVDEEVEELTVNQ